MATVALLCAVALHAADSNARTVAGAAVAPAARLAYVTETMDFAATVWTAQASGAARRVLGPGDDPKISPDGSLVAASLFGGSGIFPERGPALALYPTGGGVARTYLSLASAIVSPLAWSEDSRYLAVFVGSTSEHDEAGLSSLDVLDTRTGALATIAHGQIYGASFAPDPSDRIVYSQSPSESLAATANLYVSGPDGSAVKRLTPNGRNLFPVWGPRYIAYDREHSRRHATRVRQIWLLSPGGGRVERLTHMRVPAQDLGLMPIGFSQDGRRLLAEFGGEDTREPWTVGVPSGRARRLRVRAPQAFAEGISSDGQTLLIDEVSVGQHASSGRVVRIPFAGGPAKVLIAHGAQSSWDG